MKLSIILILCLLSFHSLYSIEILNETIYKNDEISLLPLSLKIINNKIFVLNQFHRKSDKDPLGNNYSLKFDVFNLELFNHNSEYVLFDGFYSLSRNFEEKNNELYSICSYPTGDHFIANFNLQTKNINTKDFYYDSNEFFGFGKTLKLNNQVYHFLPFNKKIVDANGVLKSKSTGLKKIDKDGNILDSMTFQINDTSKTDFNNGEIFYFDNNNFIFTNNYFAENKNICLVTLSDLNGQIIWNMNLMYDQLHRLISVIKHEDYIYLLLHGGSRKQNHTTLIKLELNGNIIFQKNYNEQFNFNSPAGIEVLNNNLLVYGGASNEYDLDLEFPIYKRFIEEISLSGDLVSFDIQNEDKVVSRYSCSFKDKDGNIFLAGESDYKLILTKINGNVSSIESNYSESELINSSELVLFDLLGRVIKTFNNYEELKGNIPNFNPPLLLRWKDNQNIYHFQKF